MDQNGYGSRPGHQPVEAALGPAGRTAPPAAGPVPPAAHGSLPGPGGRPGARRRRGEPSDPDTGYRTDPDYLESPGPPAPRTPGGEPGGRARLARGPGRGLVAGVLVAAVLGGLLVGALLGLTGPAGPPVAQPTTVTAPTSSPAPSILHYPSATAEPKQGYPSPDFGFVTQARENGGTVTITYNRANLHLGEEAARLAGDKDGHDRSGEGWFVNDDNTLLRNVEFAENVTVMGAEKLAGSAGPKPVGAEAVVDYFDAESAEDVPVWLHFDEDGRVTRIEEVVLP